MTSGSVILSSEYYFLLHALIEPESISRRREHAHWWACVCVLAVYVNKRTVQYNVSIHKRVCSSWTSAVSSCVYGLCHDVIDRTQVRRGPPDSSPQQSGTSRTVKRYPSSSGPITSNALPSANGYANGHAVEQRNWHRNGQGNTHRPSGGSQQPAQFNNVLSPAGRNEKRCLFRCIMCLLADDVQASN